jgi:hypothetical protein
MKNRGLFKLIILLLFVSGISCNKMKYGRFAIHQIILMAYSGNTTNSSPNIYFHVVGPGLDNITHTTPYPDRNQDVVFWPDFQGSRGVAKYDITLVEALASGDNDLQTITVDFGKYKGQEGFVVKENGMMIQLSLSWHRRF